MTRDIAVGQQDYAITLCGRFDNSKQSFPIQMDIACGNSCLIISTTTVAKQSVRIVGCSGRWVARWTQSAWCEISADVVAMVHATTSLFIFHENESGRGEIVGPTFPTTRFQICNGALSAIVDPINPSRRYPATQLFEEM